MLGSWVKQRMGTALPMAAQPGLAASSVSICSRVMPCSGFAGWDGFMATMFNGIAHPGGSSEHYIHAQDSTFILFASFTLYDGAVITA